MNQNTVRIDLVVTVTANVVSLFYDKDFFSEHSGDAFSKNTTAQTSSDYDIPKQLVLHDFSSPSFMQPRKLFTKNLEQTQNVKEKVSIDTFLVNANFIFANTIGHLHLFSSLLKPSS
jgi:hypothetical protein